VMLSRAEKTNNQLSTAGLFVFKEVFPRTGAFSSRVVVMSQGQGTAAVEILAVSGAAIRKVGCEHPVVFGTPVHTLERMIQCCMLSDSRADPVCWIMLIGIVFLLEYYVSFFP